MLICSTTLYILYVMYYVVFLQEADTFEGKELCIIQGSTSHSKQKLEEDIVRMGGTIVQNAGKYYYSFTIVSEIMCIS